MSTTATANIDDSSSSDEGESLGDLRKRKLAEHGAKTKKRLKKHTKDNGSVAVKVEKKRKKKSKASSSSSSSSETKPKPKARKKKKVKFEPRKRVKGRGKAAEKKQLKLLNESQHLDQAVRAYRWWDAEQHKKQRDQNGNFFVPNWRTLEHRGVVFPPPAERLPEGVHLYYNGNAVEVCVPLLAFYFVGVKICVESSNVSL